MLEDLSYAIINSFLLIKRANLQNYHYRLTLKLVGQVLRVKKRATTLKHKLATRKIIMRLLNN